MAATAGGVPAGATTVTVQTDANGFAEAFWMPANDASRPVQQANATLSAAPANSGFPLGSPVAVRFNGRLSVAANVGYTPASNCSLPQSVNNVQAALDQICAGIGAPPQRIVVQSVNVGGVPLTHGALFSGVTVAASGIDIVCDRALDTLSGSSYAGELVLDLADSSVGFLVATRPQTISGAVSVSGNTLRWRAGFFAVSYLQQFTANLFWTQARLVVRGNFVWDAQEAERYLDPDLFAGRQGQSSITRFPTGNGVRGGEMVLFFNLGTPFNIGFGPVASAGNTVGTISLDQPAPEGGLTVRLASEDPAVTALPETVFVPAGETTATFDAKVKAPRSGALNLQISSTVAEVGSKPVPETSLTHDVTLKRARK